MERLFCFHSPRPLQDREGAGLVRDKTHRCFPCLDMIWVDGGHNAWRADAVMVKVPRLRLAMVKRFDNAKGVVLLTCRWVVEPTFPWFGRNRWLAKVLRTSPKPWPRSSPR